MSVNTSQAGGSWSGAQPPLQEAAARFQAVLGPQGLARLSRGAPACAADLFKLVLLQIPALSLSRNPGLLPLVEQHVGQLVAQVPAVLAGPGTRDNAFITAYAQALAAQHFPLEAALHVYRCGLKRLTQWLREAALAGKPADAEAAIVASADFAIEFINAASADMAADYVAQARALAGAEGGLKVELLNMLLGGYDESDGRVALMLKAAGFLEQRQSYCVVAVRATAAAEMASPGRAERIIAALEAQVAATPFRILVGVHNGVVTAVLSTQRRQSGWTAPQTQLAARLALMLEGLGPSVLVGLSTDQPSTSSIPKALREAMVALERADVARRVVQFANLPLRALMLHRQSEFLHSVLPAWGSALLAADKAAKGQLRATLRALADADLNVQAAGRALGLHANTIYARAERIKDVTGLDPQRHHDLVELLIAADCAAG